MPWVLENMKFISCVDILINTQNLFLISAQPCNILHWSGKSVYKFLQKSCHRKQVETFGSMIDIDVFNFLILHWN